MLALTALASACTTAPSRPVVAPAVVEYSREFQARAADELDALPPACRRDAPGADCSALRVIMDDAAELRAQVRALNERSEEHTSELKSLMRISYAVFCLKKKIKTT